MQLDPNSLLAQIPVRAGPVVRLPREFERLYDLAHNLWWTWDGSARKLWSQIDSRLWSQNRNPLSLLQAVDRETWEALATDGDFIETYQQVCSRFDAYMTGTDTWYARNHTDGLPGPVAYLCAEFGVHHTLPFYSGGLGVLAGDHAKAASDLGLPFVGVGLKYRRGYFRQTIDPDGNQQEQYRVIEMNRRPFREVIGRDRQPLRIAIDLPDREVVARVWRIDVGRVPLLLLDTFLADNDPADRPITQILYVRGREMRFVQEMLLGIGGVRLVEALRLEPSVWHVNEGHAAMSLLERTSEAVKGGLEFDAAIKTVGRNTLFTLHTPVPAGNEVFDLSIAEAYLDGTLPGVPEEALAELGRGRDGDHRFDLGALAIRLSAMTNGVSRRHGEVVTGDWEQLIGGPALAFTNGVHMPTWVGRAVGRLYEHALGPDWPDKLTTPEAWEAIHDLPDKTVWEAHKAQKELMTLRLRARILDQKARHGASPEVLLRIDDQLPAQRLTIGFARRFATYKRAGLFFSDPGRARAILTNPERPVQMIFAGKAHPADRDAQGLIRWISELAASPYLAGHVYLLEDYDMQLAGWLVGGCDVWLNNPRPPQEASGTSGMKAAANGGLNLSVLDGWWLEGFDGENGWGFGSEYHSDAEDAGTLYHLMETEVVPQFYERDADGVPTAWVARMKRAMASITPAFSTHRMVADYATQAYFPLADS